ncbi:MAG: molybdopterin molybdotransferase MoeA [SAR324 cluster bacterium]|nr:molybdopterin molybdotransferase MoeA [SAR324 cluster bacterium]
MADVRMRGFKHRTEVAAFQGLIRERIGPVGTEEVALSEAGARVLAEPVVSTVDVPLFVRSAMDGYALKSEETFGAGPYNPLSFKIIGEVTPGAVFPGKVEKGEAVRIMTGAPLPEGADAVLMAEYASEHNGIMTAMEPVAPQKNIGRIGEDIRAGSELFRPGRRLRAQDVGILASIGAARVPVRKKPGVCLLITGNELLKPGEKPEGSKIVDSNSIMLKMLVERDGGVVTEIRHLPDDKEVIRDSLRNAPGDLLVTTGGTSVGVEDHAPVLVAEEGELLVHGIAMRPSAPTGFGVAGGRPVFLVPGNPVSCLAAYDFFVGLAVRRMGGRPEPWPYRPARYPLSTRIASEIGRVDYARVKVTNGHAELLATSGASILSTTTLADGFVVVEQDSEGMAAGETVTVWLYD